MRKILYIFLSILFIITTLFFLAIAVYELKSEECLDWLTLFISLWAFGFSMLFYFKLKTEIWREKKNLGIELRMTRFEHIMLRCIGPAFLIVFTLIAAMIVFTKLFFIVKKLLGY